MKMIRINSDGAHVREDRIVAVTPLWKGDKIVGCRVHLRDGSSLCSDGTCDDAVDRMTGRLTSR